MTDISCKICNKKITPTILFNNQNKRSRLLKCPNCKVKFVHPLPADQEILSYYNGMYEDLTFKFDELKLKYAQIALDKYIHLLKNLNEWPKFKFLDLGGGLGYYSLAAQKKGFKSTLVDLDSVSISFAKNTLKIKDAFLGNFDDFIATSKDKFDFILCRHVIEHFKDPDVIPKAINSLLSDNGIAVVETDNSRSFDLILKPGTSDFYYHIYAKNYTGVNYLKLFLKRPFALDPPRHLYSFSLTNLEFFFRKFELRTIYKSTYMLGDKYFWPNIPQANFKSLRTAFKNKNYTVFKHDLKDISVFPIRKFLNKFYLGAGVQIIIKKNHRMSK